MASPTLTDASPARIRSCADGLRRRRSRSGPALARQPRAVRSGIRHSGRAGPVQVLAHGALGERRLTEPGRDHMRAALAERDPLDQLGVFKCLQTLPDGVEQLLEAPALARVG